MRIQLRAQLLLMAETVWLELLGPLRSRLSGRDHRGKRGSLRWLEAIIAEEGGRAGTVRNILYKDLGSVEEKERLYALFKRLYAEVGLEPPPRPGDLHLAAAKRLLGRDKRIIFARFNRSLGEGETPQLVVVGPPATGKSVLLEQLRLAHPEHLFANLARDLAPPLLALAEVLGVASELQRHVAQLSPAHPYAVQAQAQRDLRELFIAPLNRLGRPLFLRAEKEAALSGLALRDASGATCELSAWLEPLLVRLTIPYVVACSSAPPRLPHARLRPPSRQDARSYLRERLPEAAPETLENLLNRAGRNYGELSRLALLELVRQGGGNESELHRDPRLGPLLAALAALSPESDPELPVELLETVLGKRLAALSQAERALLEQRGPLLRPAIRALLPPDANAEAIHRRALEYFRGTGHPFRIVYHAKAAGAWDTLCAALAEDPSRLALLPGLWEEAQGWPLELRERLAVVVVRYRSVLGDYGHPEARAALELLSAAPDETLSAWARVKMCEALIDEGDFEGAAEVIVALERLTDEVRAEGFLVEAALKRWRGDYDGAEALVERALELSIPPVLADRARLWQGLVAKDAGRFDEALASLRAVRHLPLLMGRARYQEGDILLRLGVPEEGEACIREALAHLREMATAEEQARVRSRLATALQHLGRHREAALHFRRALRTAPDPFTRARIASEAAFFEAVRGRPWEAVRLAGEAERFFRGTELRPEEAAYRRRRTRYRLAVAYWVWETGEPFCSPLRGGRSSAQAVRLLEPLICEVEPLADEADRYASLFLDATRLLALMSPPQAAWRRLEAVRALPSAHLCHQLGLCRAETRLRLGDAQGAAAELVLLRHLPPDPGLRAWKAIIEAELALLLGQDALATEVIAEACALPAPFRAQLGRRWGQVLLERGRADLAAVWLIDPDPLALPEALGLEFERAEGGT